MRAMLSRLQHYPRLRAPPPGACGSAWPIAGRRRCCSQPSLLLRRAAASAAGAADAASVGADEPEQPHVSVLLQEVLQHFADRPAKVRRSALSSTAQ